jgi:integrase/recombinase XerD
MTAMMREALTDYLALRRSLGYALVRDEKLLHQFLDWVYQHERDHITVDDVLTWVRLPEPASASWLRMRMRVVRGFAGYLHDIDPVHEVPPPGLVPGRVARAVPYLYSQTEIAALIAEADQLSTPLRRATITTLIGLLAVTGMFSRGQWPVRQRGSLSLCSSEADAGDAIGRNRCGASGLAGVIAAGLAC